MKYSIAILFLAIVMVAGCKKKDTTPPVVVPPKLLSASSIQLDGTSWSNRKYGTKRQPVIKVRFSEKVKQSTVAAAVKLADTGGAGASLNISYENNDSVVVLQPSTPLTALALYRFTIASTLKSAAGGDFVSTVDQDFITQIDSTRKFPVISDVALLDLVQQQTFKYFWDFGHPVSGLARERNTSGETVTSGGSGFGVMAIVTGINRNFITRAQGLARMQTIVAFLKTTALVKWNYRCGDSIQYKR